MNWDPTYRYADMDISDSIFLYFDISLPSLVGQYEIAQ